MTEPFRYELYPGSDQFAWHARRWPEFVNLGSRAHVIVPIYSLSEWGLGRPLDAEELIGSAVLEAGLNALKDTDFIVLPPMRFTPKQSVGTCFGLDIEDAHQILEETLCSAAKAGVNRFILWNTSPFLEEWVDVAARDLRIQHDFQMFCINLSGLGLDFHPQRGQCRSGIQKILTELLDTKAEGGSSELAVDLDPIPDCAVPVGPILTEGEGDAETLVQVVAERMKQLLSEIKAHPDLVAEDLL